MNNVSPTTIDILLTQDIKFSKTYKKPKNIIIMNANKNKAKVRRKLVTNKNDCFKK